MFKDFFDFQVKKVKKGEKILKKPEKVKKGEEKTLFSMVKLILKGEKTRKIGKN